MKPNQEDDPCPIVCESSLNRLATFIGESQTLCRKRLTGYLGGDTILPHLSEVVQALLKNPDWRCRYSALTVIGSVADACLQVNERDQRYVEHS